MENLRPLTKIFARKGDLVCVETNDQSKPFYVLSPVKSGAKIPDYFCASFKELEEVISPLINSYYVKVRVNGWFYKKIEALYFMEAIQ